MLDLLTSTYKNINRFNSKHTAFMQLGLEKAFDTVSYVILLRKLQYYGIRGAASNLSASFLINRFQFVCYSLSNVRSNYILYLLHVESHKVLFCTSSFCL